MISFATAPEDEPLLLAAANRAAAIDKEYNGAKARKERDWLMDLTACHANGCPLDLARMLKADRFNFVHDAFGIARHLDRDDASPTGGQLLDHFWPRFALKGC